MEVVYTGTLVVISKPEDFNGEYLVKLMNSKKSWYSDLDGNGSIPESLWGSEAEAEALSAFKTLSI